MDQPVSDLLLELKEPVMIAPAEPTESRTLFLSNIDQEAIYKVDTVYFFEANPSKGAEDIVAVVKQALSKVLVPYYFLAGRFRANVSEQRIELDCNGAGVLFAAAKSMLSLADLGDVSIPNPAYRDLLVQPSDSVGLFDTPVTTYQVTTFSCGGFAFATSIFHSLMDGTGITGFIRNLGSIARGEGLVMVPDPNREFLKARSPPQPKYYEEVTSSMFRVSKFAEIPLLPFNPTLGSINNFAAPETHLFKVFPFSNRQLLDLKARALGDGFLKTCSTFEAVTAHVLREVARSRNLNPDTFISMFMAVDFMRKLNPPPPKNFCGNAVCTACIAATVGELCSNTLGYFTQKVQAALNDVNDEFVRSWTDFWELHRIGPARIPTGACISGWWKLPFYDLDFGWGKPIFTGPVPNQLVGFVVLLSNGKNDGGAYIYLSLERHEMTAFESNIYSIFQA